MAEAPVATPQFVLYQTEDGNSRIQVRLEDETVWLSQAHLVELFQTSKQNISLHIRNIFAEGELSKASVVKEYLTTAADGKTYRTKLYSLDNEREILDHAGKVAKEVADRLALDRYDRFNASRLLDQAVAEARADDEALAQLEASERARPKKGKRHG